MSFSRRSIAAAVSAACLSTTSAFAQTCGLTRVSLDSSGFEADFGSVTTSTSYDGRFVAFTSSATTLVPNDLNSRDDVFVRDAWTNTTERVSEPQGGGEGDGGSGYPSISDDGRYVVFSSWATNLVAGDTNNTNDVFVRDRAAGTTERLSVPPAGAGLGTEGDASSFVGMISPDGRYVTFLSFASNLVPGDTNFSRDVFLVDRVSGSIERVSIGDQGQEGDDLSGGNGISAFVSADGRYVAFTSSASNLVPGDTNGLPDVFVRDRLLGTTRRVSIAPGGFDPDDAVELTSMTTDGRLLGITSAASNLVPGDTNQVLDCFVLTVATGAFERISVSDAGTEGSLGSWALSLSRDGRFGAFLSNSPDLVSLDGNQRRDVFVRDIDAHTTTLASLSDFGGQCGADCFSLSFSGDGAVIAFSSLSDNLVGFDYNGTADAFRRECRVGTLFCSPTNSTCPCGNGGNGRSGCGNSTGVGALLDVRGVPSISGDTLALIATGLPSATPVLFLQSPHPAGSSGGPFGDGVRCVAGPITFLGVAYARQGIATFGYASSGAPLSVLAVLSPTGDVRTYQAWYRDTASFCTSQPFNMTNGVEVWWTS